MSRAIVIGLAWIGAAGVAYADAVPPPATGCPNGTVGATGHTGPYCAPASCTLDSDCREGTTCREEALCILPLQCGGLRPSDAGLCTVDSVTALCEGAQACASGTCTTRRVCVASSVAPSGGCACGVGSAHAGLAPLFAAMLGITFLRRRARRSRA